MRYELKVNATNEALSSAIHFIEEKLREHHYEDKKIIRCLLVSEEIMVHMLEKAVKNSFLSISINAQKKTAEVTISSKGEKCEVSQAVALGNIPNYEEMDDESASVISDLILKSFSKQITTRYWKGINRATVNLDAENKKSSGSTILFLVLGLFVGLIFKLVIPVSISNFVQTNIISLITQIFLRTIGMLVVPLVFFSIADSITGFSDMKTFGRIGVKVLSLYTLTTALAMFVCYGAFSLIKPGDVSLLPNVMKMIDANYEVTSMKVSLRDTFLNIFPRSFFGAFSDGDMLQVIFIAILLGFASGKIGKYSDGFINFIKAGNALFLKVTEIVIKILPAAIFSMGFTMVYCMDFAALIHIGLLALVLLISFISMFLVYSSIILFIGKYNPIKFFKNYKESLITAFSSCSSGVTMPFSMAALERVGVSPKIYSFSIPLGATINMDGASISFLLTSLFACRIFGIELNPSTILTLMVSIMIMSFGAPCVAGGSIAFITMLLSILGLPVGAVAFLTPISSAFEFFETMLNVAGDGAVTMAVARSENLITDKE